MFEKSVRLVALSLFAISGLCLSLMAIVAGCFLGGLAGYSSISLLEALLPQLRIERAWGGEIEVCGAALGSLGAIAVVARFCWSQLKQGGDAKIEAFVARIEKLWRASST